MKRVRSVPFSEIKLETVDFLFPGRIALREMTILAGVPGIGKSQLICLLAAQLSRGELGEPGVTLLVTDEDSRSATIKPRLLAVGADLDLVHTVVIEHEDGFEGVLRLPDDMALLDQLVGDLGVRMVAIDPLFNHLASKVDSFKDQSLRTAMGPLKHLAEKHYCAVVGVAHVNPGPSADAYVRIGGSKSGLQGPARSVMVFARDPEDPDGESGSQRVLANTKNNLAKEAPSLLYRIEEVLIPATPDTPEVKTSRLVHIGESSRSGNDLLGTADAEDRPALDEAKDFLRDELALGPRPATEVKASAKKEGIAPRTLRRALEEIGDKKKHGFGPGSTWYWFLRQGPLFTKDGQASWTPSEQDDVGHLREIPHEYAASASSTSAADIKDDHPQEMATFDLEPVEILSDGEQHLIDELRERLDATDVDEAAA